MWRKRLLKLCPGAELGPACAPVVLKKAEKALGVAFPEELRKLCGSGGRACDAVRE